MSPCALLAALVLLFVAVIAIRRALAASRRIPHPLGVPPPTGRCVRCGRNNLEKDTAGVVAHYPHYRAQTMCERRKW